MNSLQRKGIDKVCTKCKTPKPETEYHTDNGRSISICKVCKNEKSKEYRKNRDSYSKKKSKEYYTNYCIVNAERIRVNKQKYYQDHKERITKTAKRYRDYIKARNSNGGVVST